MTILPNAFVLVWPSATINSSVFLHFESQEVQSHGIEVCNLRQSAALWKRGQPRQQYPASSLESQSQARPRGGRRSSQTGSRLHRMHPVGSSEKSCLSKKP